MLKQVNNKVVFCHAKMMSLSSGESHGCIYQNFFSREKKKII